MSNPNPARITDQMWDFWLAFRALEPTVKLGGIYALKSGYHSTRNDNKSRWPDDYSIRDYQDYLGPADKAAAIDLTFPDAQSRRYETIIKYAKRLLDSGKDPNDPRGDYLREFYGQADRDQAVEGWDFRYLHTVTSDSSHLWHIHISISRQYVANPAAYAALLSILRGETVAQWRNMEEDVIYARTEANQTVWASNGVRRRPVSRMESVLGDVKYVANEAALTDLCGPPDTEDALDLSGLKPLLDLAKRLAN